MDAKLLLEKLSCGELRPEEQGRAAEVVRLLVTEAATAYWLAHYLENHCTLCGNWGVIDSRASAVTPAGYRTGRLNFCICPNGQALRLNGADVTRVLVNSGLRWDCG